MTYTVFIKLKLGSKVKISYLDNERLANWQYLFWIIEQTLSEKVLLQK